MSSTKVTLHRIALQCSPKWLGRCAVTNSLADILYTRFEELGQMSDLEEALSLYRDALELRPQGHPDRALSLGNIANCIQARASRLGALADLDEALALYRDTLELLPQWHPDRTVSLGGIASCLYDRFNLLGTPSDLDEALVFHRKTLELRPQGHPHRARSMGNIANCLHARFMLLGMLSDLGEALTLYRDTLKLCPQGHPHRVLSLGGMATCLYVRFTQLGTLSDLDEALAIHRDTLELRPQGHPDRALSLVNIASSLYVRFTQRGTLSDLDEALSLERDALELRPQGHPHRARSLCNIAHCLQSRFTRLGTLSDLDEALVLERDALELRPKGHPDRAISLSNIASSLHTRFMRLGTLSDLEEALALERGALELRPQGHPQRALSLGNIASYLHGRFTQLGTLSDLDEALALQRNALELCPQGHSYRPVSLGNIADYLRTRFKRLGILSDLDDALALYRDTLELFSQGHPHRAVSLINIATCLHARFTKLGGLSDLNEAVAIARNALELCPQGHPNRSLSLGILAHSLHARFKHSSMRETSDLQDTFALYSQLSDVTQAVSYADLQCAKQWIQAAEECEHDTTVLAYQTFLRLSIHHFAVLPSLPRHLALLKQLMTSTAVDAFSACVRARNLANAVELLEQGRGVFWSQLVRLRSPLEDLMASGDTGKELAVKFTQLTSLLRNVLDASPNAESQHDRACRLNIQVQDVVSDIRKLPALSRFLQPPLFSDLQIAAACGPVIIVNSSQYGCDALIIFPHRDPIHIALPITKASASDLSLRLRSLTSRARFGDVTRDILVFLRELWDDIVFPIVKILQESCPRGSRIWWCPTAEFSLLPLHAAGSYRKGQPILSDRYISSYTPTLTALIRAQKMSLGPSTEQHRFLLVGQAQAPGENELVSVNAELSTISQLVGPAATLTCVRDQNATIAKVSEELNKNEFVHLACHGIPDRKQPFESRFALGDGLLKVEDIMQYDSQKARFAYLSACHTTVGDEESPDEIIHLAAAMQFAGFRSVIGTMWAVDDAHTNEITSKFYAHMTDESGCLDHTRAALAVHRMTRSIRSSNIPFDQQILYIHIGA